MRGLKTPTVLLITVLLLTGCTSDSASKDSDDDISASDQPYAGLQDREIRALSAGDVDDLLAGRGAGYALAAELNSYPGPTHVLDHADELDLTDEQQKGIEAIYDSMQQEARKLGETLVDLEADLDQRFRQEHIDEDDLFDMTNEIASVEGKLRATHLSAHLEVKSILESEQIAEYDELRGYGDASDSTETEEDDHNDHGNHT
ncbi:MAG: Spy/CpxP family protein refolding chaperone [Thermomicrobiaceae bacterium]